MCTYILFHFTCKQHVHVTEQNSQRHKSRMTILMKYCSRKHILETIDGEMFFITLPTFLLQIISKPMVYSKLIVKSFIDQDDNFRGTLEHKYVNGSSSLVCLWSGD